MRNKIYLIVVFFISCNSIFAQDAFKDNPKISNEVLKELNYNVVDSNKLKDLIQMIKKMESEGIKVISTKQFNDSILSFGVKPKIENVEEYSNWKKKTVEFKETHISVSDFISRL